MAHKLVNKWWIVNKKELENLNLKDAVWREEAILINDRNFANFSLGEWYVRYCVLFNKLDRCLDQMVHPQKRVTVKKLVDAIAMRLLEFNDSFRELDFSEFHYVDGNLVELKMIPHDVEVLHPRLFAHRPPHIEDMWTKIKNGEKIWYSPEELEEMERKRREAEAKVSKRRVGPRPPSAASKIKISAKEQEAVEKLKRAVLRIQNAERGRQERNFFRIKDTLLKEKRALKAWALAKALGQIRDVETQTEEEKLMIRTAAAVIIQTYWRGYVARQKRKYDEIQRRLVIKMYQPHWRSKEEFETLEKAEHQRRKYRDLRIKQYIAAIENEKARILKVVAPKLMEDISDEIREWFYAWYSNCDMFDTFPSEKDGGTILVVTGETLTPQEYLAEKERQRAMSKKALKEEQKQKKIQEKIEKWNAKQLIKDAEKAKKKQEKERKKEQALFQPHQYKYYHDPPKNEELFKEALKEHKLIWDERDELQNPEEKHYMDLVKEDLYRDAHIECRKIVDQLMRQELNILLAAQAADKNKIFAPIPIPKTKKKKEKKDMTSDRSTEELFQELVDNGLVRNYPKVRLKDFHGDFPYSCWEYRSKDTDPPHKLLDVRQAVAMNVILPMGVSVMKRPKTVLISGPRNHGKHLLANAIFNHTNCVLFDLSPERTAEVYEGTEIKMLVHLVNKMAKIFAPSIIFFDGAEKLFYKKVPKEEKQMSPKRLGKVFKNFTAKLKNEDRIMVLGISSAPFNGKGLNKVYERHIFIRKTDYNSAYLYWNELLTPWYSVDRNINTTVLARLTIGYPFPILKKAVKEILTVRRRLALKNHPLTAEEVFMYMVNHDFLPVPDNEWNRLEQWFKSLPYTKRRAKYLKSAKEAAERDAL